MTSEVAVRPSGEIAPSGDTLLSVIAAAARDPQVDPAKMSALLALKERVESRDAEIEFNRAFARLQTKLPRVKKNGTIELGGRGKIAFAKWEDVDHVIRPILSEEGFALSFQSRPNQTGVSLVCVLTHVMGHSKTSEMQLPPDAGPGRNALQAIGSARSYGKRYLACDILNIITEGQDDDARGTSLITDEQCATIETMISACELTKERQSKLFALAGVKRVREIQKSQYEAVMEALRAEERKRRSA